MSQNGKGCHPRDPFRAIPREEWIERYDQVDWSTLRCTCIRFINGKAIASRDENCPEHKGRW